MASKTRFVVISGVSRGLGRALALGFAARGLQVAGCARSAEGLEALGLELGQPHQLARVDVGDDDAVREWAAALLQAQGPPDLLINNAGLMNHPAPLWEVPAAEVEALLRVNVAGTVNLIRRFLPAMIERGSGLVVNLSSAWGRSTDPEVAPYCATKWAIEGLTGALASELPAGLSAVALNPGIVDTDMLRCCWAEGAEAYPRPARWAEAAVPYLLSLGPKDNGRSLSVPL